MRFGAFPSCARLPIEPCGAPCDCACGPDCVPCSPLVAAGWFTPAGLRPFSLPLCATASPAPAKSEVAAVATSRVRFILIALFICRSLFICPSYVPSGPHPLAVQRLLTRRVPTGSRVETTRDEHAFTRRQ